MYRKNISQNLAWIHVAAHNVQPLLIKWGIVYLTAFAIYAAGSINTYIASNAAQRSAEAVPWEATTTSPESKIIPTNTALKQQTVLPIQATAPTPSPSAPAPLIDPSHLNNTYARGNCTWYANFRRPDLPNTLGNANTWFIRAQQQGLATGLEARPAAIGQRGMHVVFVESVNTDGTMNISEMNFIGLYKISHRTIPTAGWQFIY